MQTPAKPAKTKRTDEDYSTPYAPPVATPAPILTASAVSAPASKKPQVFVTLAEMSVTDDALPTSRTLPVNKYHAVFANMKLGQCVRCPTVSVGKVSGSMRKFIANQNLHAQIKSVTRFEGDDGFGRVWMLPAAAQALKSVA